MEPSQQNQYFFQPYPVYPPMNMPINNSQPYGFPIFFGHQNNGFYHQMQYPYPFIPTMQPFEQNPNLVSENASLENMENLLLDTIPDLDGTEGSFEIKKFFKKFKVSTEDWPDKKRIKALKSKLSFRASHAFKKAIAKEPLTYASISQNILSQLLPNEFKNILQKNHQNLKETTKERQNLKEITKEKKNLGENQSSLGCSFRTNSPQKKKNLKEHEKISKPQNIPTPSFKNKVNIQFEKEEFSKEILEFFEMPINQDSAKEEIEIENLEKGKLLEDLVIVEKDLICEKELNVEPLEDFGNEQFCELEVELKCSLDGKQDLVSVEFPIPTEINVFQEIVPLNIPVSHEENKEEIVCSESEELVEIIEGGEECFDLEKAVEEFVDLKEKDEYHDDLKENSDEKEILGSRLEVFESDPEKEIQPTRDKLNVLKKNDNIVKERRNLLRSKLKEARIMLKLRCEILRKEILRNDLGDFGYGFLKRKITGRFFLGVRRCLNSEKLVTFIRVPELSRKFLKEINRRMLESKLMKVLYLVSVTMQDVICESKDDGIEKDWKKRKRKQEKGLVESVSVTEVLTIGVLLETFHRRSGLITRVGLENPMINVDTENSQEKEKTTSPPKTFRENRPRWKILF